MFVYLVLSLSSYQIEQKIECHQTKNWNQRPSPPQRSVGACVTAVACSKALLQLGRSKLSRQEELRGKRMVFFTQDSVS